MRWSSWTFFTMMILTWCMAQQHHLGGDHQFSHMHTSLCGHRITHAHHKHINKMNVVAHRFFPTHLFFLIVSLFDCWRLLQNTWWVSWLRVLYLSDPCTNICYDSRFFCVSPPQHNHILVNGTLAASKFYFIKRAKHNDNKANGSTRITMKP